MEMLPAAKSSRHRSVASQETNASMFADSTMTFGTMGSVQLSQFPAPPSEVPVTPTQSAFSTSSPSRSVFAISPPATPTRTHGTPIYFSSTTPLIPQRKGSASADQGSAPTSQRPPRVVRAEHEHARSSSPPPLPTAPYRAPNDGIHREGSPPPPPYFPSPLVRAVSPHDWHEGASSIDVDATEDRLLSTSFITSLLSSTETASEKSVPRSLTSGQHSIGTNRTSLSAFSGMSASSEVTYPPTSPSPAYHRYPPQVPSTAQQATRTHGRGPPPTAYIPVEEDGSGLNTMSSCTSGDSATLISTGDSGPSSILRTASISRTSGVRGASIVGVVQAKLHGISGTRLHHPTAVNVDSRNEGIASGPPEDTIDPEKLGVVDHRVASSSVISSAAPAMATQSHFFHESTCRETRQLVHSTKVVRNHTPSFISSAKSIKLAFRSLWAKPLPHLPTVTRTMSSRRAEDEMPLPELVNRAEMLSHMLVNGQHPHRSLNSHVIDGETSELKGNGTESTMIFDSMSAPAENLDPTSHATGLWHSPPDHGRQRTGESLEDSLIEPPSPTKRPSSRKKKVLLAIGVCASIAVIVGVAVGLIEKHKESKAPICAGNFTGSACNLDATCMCTSSQPGQCNGLAQSLASLIPTVNSLFATNYTATSLATEIWQAQGAPIGNNCAAQSILVDVAPTLHSAKWPNRTEWAQSALLWNLVQSQNLTAVAEMRSFVVHAAWGTLGDDGPVADTSTAFSITSTGFVFNFAAQTVTQPNATFLDNGQPTSAQIAQVGDIARSGLDRMYSYALASSTQRQDALATYWRTILQQDPADLAVFVSAVRASPILVPFDATSSGVASLLTTSTSAPFPPPIACYLGLNSSQIQRINAIETLIFGLPPISAATRFDTSCFPARPLYGVLDILRMRLPFIDSRIGVAKQAAILTRDVGPRAVVYSGEILSAFPNVSDIPNTTVTHTDPRQYGTLNNINHVLLNYFSSIPDINVATALVKFVLSSPAVPPTNTSILMQSLTSIPVLEVGIFGTVIPSDISSSVSSLTTPSGGLFFGSDQATLLRNWTITGTGTSVAWTEFASSPMVVRDDSYDNTVFNDVWNAVSTYLHTSNPGVTVGVSNITQSFQDTDSFSP